MLQLVDTAQDTAKASLRFAHSPAAPSQAVVKQILFESAFWPYLFQ